MQDLYETATERQGPLKEDEEDNYVTASQYDREDVADDDEGAPDMLDDDQPQAYSLNAIGKSNSAPIPRVIGWQISEVRYPRSLPFCSSIYRRSPCTSFTNRTASLESPAPIDHICAGGFTASLVRHKRASVCRTRRRAHSSSVSARCPHTLPWTCKMAFACVTGVWSIASRSAS